ncbi:hypothetical protein ACEPAI_5592 [Sanghuangporus weigelae]
MFRWKSPFSIQFIRVFLSDVLSRNGYKRLEQEDDGALPSPLLAHTPHSRCRRSVSVLGMVAFSLVLLWCICAFLGPSGASPSGSFPVTPEIQFSRHAKHSWAMYSPYFPAAEYKNPPSHCKVNQVNIIHRHGARFPTSDAGERILSAVQKLLNATLFRDVRLHFLRHYTYDLGVADLIPFGAAQSYDSGQEAFLRYKDVIDSSNPFVRASSAARVVDTANNWTSGFSHASGGSSAPTLNLILQETLNDTLNDHMCPNAGSGDEQTDIWQEIYAVSAAGRLNRAAPGANLTVADITNLISLCAFDTLAKEEPSPFCDLFDSSDFNGFEYYGDLNKYYGTGYGQDLGPVQGVGYINELIARLTDSPVRDNTQTNRTLDSDPLTFPLGRAMYADFSHDNQMIAIYSAIGLFRQKADLDPMQPDSRRTWVVSRLVPFSGRLVTERLDCNDEAFVRMFVDDALQDLTFCGADEDGLCTLDAFVASQGYATNDGAGDFERCFT